MQGHHTLGESTLVRHTLWLGLVWEQEPHTSETGRVKLRAHPMDPQTEVVVEQMMEARCCKVTTCVRPTGGVDDE